MTQSTQSWVLQGGLNLATPAIRTPPGHCIAAKNYEPAVRGYRRCDGFERFDGRTKPSAATYHVLDFDAGSGAMTAGQTVTGATSGATGELLVDAVVESGSYGGSNAAGYLVMTLVSGTFQDNEALQVAAVTKATANGAAIARSADNDTDDTTWIRDAIETVRADIQAVPGSGRVRGVWVDPQGDVYAFRDNAGATACVMHKATASGWVAQSLGSTLDFDGGTVAFTEGATVTGGTSGATATIKRAIVQSGSFSGGSADGYLVLSGITGTFQNNETITDGSGGAAVADGTVTAIALPAGGRYEFVNHNFYGASNLRRMYGVNGVGKAFEWDGTVFVPLRTGMATDTPDHIAVYKNHLFLSFAGGSVQHSGIGEPTSFTIVTGASEIGLGQEVTGFLADTQGVLAIFGRNKVALLYGNDSSDWALDVLSEDAGAVEWTLQKIGNGVYMDDIGLRSLTPTDKFGDFQVGTITGLVETVFRVNRKGGVTPTASVRVRSKAQYRLFWSDGTGLCVYFGRKYPESMPFDLGMTVRCICSSEDDDGNEIIFFGSDDGYVYQLDSGTSFDGAEVEAFLRLPFNPIGSPTQDKRFHKATLEVDASSGTSLAIIAEFSYADDETPPVDEQAFAVSGGGGFWSESDWDEFLWSAPAEGLAEAYIDGIGRNVSIGVVSRAIYEDPHTVHGLTLHFSPRRLRR